MEFLGSTDIVVVVPNHRDLLRLRIKMAVWFALIWGTFFVLVASGAAQNIHVLYFVAASLAFHFVPAIIPSAAAT